MNFIYVYTECLKVLNNELVRFRLKLTIISFISGVGKLFSAMKTEKLRTHHEF